MTLTLQHDEVQQYFDMKDDIIVYKERIAELEKLFHIVDIKTSNEVVLPTQEDIYSFVTSAYSYTPVDQHKQWSQEDIASLKDRIFFQGKYSRDDLNIHTIHRTLFPHRTLDGVKSKVYDLGGRCKNDQISPKIKR